MKLREDGGRVDDPAPEFECNAGCGAPVFRQYSLCRSCYVMYDSERDRFRALLRKRGFVRRDGAWRPPRRAG